MGLFSLPSDGKGNIVSDPTPEQLVQCAIDNLELWKQNQDSDYLISTFAMSYLNNAMRKLRFDDSVRSLSDVPCD